MQIDTVATCTAIHIGFVGYRNSPKGPKIENRTGAMTGTKSSTSASVRFVSCCGIEIPPSHWGAVSPGCVAIALDPRLQTSLAQRQRRNTTSAAGMPAASIKAQGSLGYSGGITHHLERPVHSFCLEPVPSTCRIPIGFRLRKGQPLWPEDRPRTWCDLKPARELASLTVISSSVSVSFFTCVQFSLNP